MHKLEDIKLAVIGLGYVGLPLAVEFGEKRSVIGFDINQSPIDALRGGHDSTLELSDEELKEAAQLTYTANAADLDAANVYIVTVPTPIDEHKQPGLTPLCKATETIGLSWVSHGSARPNPLVIGEPASSAMKNV